MPTIDEVKAGWKKYSDFEDEKDQYIMGKILKSQGIGKKKRKQLVASFYDHNFSPGEIPPKLREEMEFTINNFFHAIKIPFTPIISHKVKEPFHGRRRSAFPMGSTSGSFISPPIDDDDPTWKEQGIGIEKDSNPKKINKYINEIKEFNKGIQERDTTAHTSTGSVPCPRCGKQMFLDNKRAEYYCEKCGITIEAPPITDTSRVNPTDAVPIPKEGDVIRGEVINELALPYNEGLLRRVGGTIKEGVTLAFLVAEPKVAYAVYMKSKGWEELFKQFKKVLMELQKAVSKDKRFYIPNVTNIDKHFCEIFDDTKLLRLKDITGLNHVSLAGFANNLYLFTMRECLVMMEQIEQDAIKKKKKPQRSYLGLAALYLNYCDIVNNIYRGALNKAKLARRLNKELAKVAKSIKPPIDKPEFMDLYGIGRKKKNSFYRRIHEVEKFTKDEENQGIIYGMSGKFFAFGSPLDPYLYLGSDRVARDDFSFFEPLGTIYRWKEQVKRCAMAQFKGVIKGPDVKSKGRKHSV